METVNTPQEYTRLTALLVYLAAQCESLGKPLGLTFLNKVLYYIDFGHFAKHKSAITHLHYKKNQFGPVPADLSYYLGELVNEGILRMQPHQYPTTGKEGLVVGTGRTKEAPILLEVFDPDERNTILKTLEALSAMTPTEVSKRSHYDYTWTVAEMHGDIPIEGAKFCDFEWLGYFTNGKTAEDFQALQKLRAALQADPKVRSAFDRINKKLGKKS